MAAEETWGHRALPMPTQWGKAGVRARSPAFVTQQPPFSTLGTCVLTRGARRLGVAGVQAGESLHAPCVGPGACGAGGVWGSPSPVSVSEKSRLKRAQFCQSWGKMRVRPIQLPSLFLREKTQAWAEL